jgi:signal transduction histidine kinase
VHPDDREAVRAAGERILQTGDYIGQPHRLVRPDGEVRWILPTGKVVKAPDGTPERVVGGNVDVTRESSLQEQLRHARRMEAVGNLTAGVAHNFNNMLMAIMPALQLLRDVVPATHTEVLDDAQHAARRGAELVRQLMRFTRRGTRVGRVPRDVASIVKRASTICRRTFDPRIGLIEDIRPDLPAVDCDPGDVEQVLVNLLLNARDAVAECSSPTIVVHARRHDAPTPLGNEHDPRAMWVRIDVQDNGVGIDAAHVERVFEPFFTTKTTGGSGLGLATSYAIAEDHGGWLSMSSTPGDGSTISLFLPGSTARATATGETPVDIRTSAFGRVLLVDDEAIVRRTVSRVLRERGFEVSTAASVEEALHRLGETPAIDVILLDRSMPGTAGDALVPRARQIVPATRVLFFTGQDVEPDAAALVDGVVQKPASTPELVAAIENAIATAREATG